VCQCETIGGPSKSRFVCANSTPETEKKRSPDESVKKQIVQAHSGDSQSPVLTTEGSRNRGTSNRRSMKEIRFPDREEQKFLV
jgi:hypothetical protein